MTASLNRSAGVPLVPPTSFSTPPRSDFPHSTSSHPLCQPSNPRALMAANKAVARFVCLSSVRFCSCSSGNEDTAAMRLCVLRRMSSSGSTYTPSRAPAALCLLMSSTDARYFCNCVSTSSATLGKGYAPQPSQKKSRSSTSYERGACLPPAPPAGLGSFADSTMRFSFMPKTSCTSGLYVHTCCRADPKSKFRSNRHSNGREREAARPNTPSANRLLRAFKESLSFWSSSPATCSAAPPLGHRMMGTTPRVTHTLNRPSTMWPTAASICVSFADGSFSST
mmetsp:Transcript_4480/g.12208  ORF Transcript_4480/g.12208 Transcript_4480/m.12208 type:complete len:281 (-) Transcript_4480:614-1456(-)